MYDGEKNPWEAWDDYMKSKVSKLDEQFAHLPVDDDVKRTKIFDGVSIYVNGYTEPSAEELKRLMKIHGGHYSIYYDKSITTHIIATNMAQTKIKALKDEKVVHPDWIVKSIESGKLLPYEDYELYPMAQRKGVQSLNKFWKMEKNKGSKSALDEEKISKEKTKTSSSSSDSVSLHSAQNPNFLNSFFSRSRLHHISTLANEMKNYLATKKTEVKSVEAVLEKIQHVERTKAFSSREDVFFHLDMDCFFASVAIKSRPNLKDEPVVITHSKHSNVETGRESYAEIASCNYVARSFGISNGMILGKARTLCKNLICLPYEFDKYAETSRLFYDIISSYPLEVEAVSCDEVLVNATEFLIDYNIDPESFVTHIRNEIQSKTLCPCSCGIGMNPLLARLATTVAKPNGQYMVKDPMLFMERIDVSRLPGVGYTLADKLNNNFHIKTCKDLRALSLEQLQTEFGKMTGYYLFNACRGVDTRKRPTGTRKSISVNVNYGIRLETLNELETFIHKLSAELSIRMQEADVKGQHLTLKLKIKASNAPRQTLKFLGHGECDDRCVSTTMNKFTNDANDIEVNAMKLIKSLNAEIEDLRGIALQVTKLKETSSSSSTDKSDMKSLDEFFNRNPVEALLSQQQCINVKETDSHQEMDSDAMTRKSSCSRTVQCPDVHHLDLSPVPLLQNVAVAPTVVQPSNERRLNSKKPSVISSLDAFVIRRNTAAAKVETVEDIIVNADPNILQELPTQIREEVRKEQDTLKRRREKQMAIRNKRKKVNNRQKQKHLVMLKNRKLHKVDRSQGPDQYCFKSNLSELPHTHVVELLRMWITASENISNIDIELLKSYIRDLLDRRSYEQVATMVRILKNGIHSNSGTIYDVQLKDLIAYAKEQFERIYGCVLDA